MGKIQEKPKPFHMTRVAPEINTTNKDGNAYGGELGSICNTTPRTPFRPAGQHSEGSSKDKGKWGGKRKETGETIQENNPEKGERDWYSYDWGTGEKGGKSRKTGRTHLK